MKKYLFILSLVGTALFTACSTADDLVADIPSTGLTEEEKAIIVEAGLDSDVPITLGNVVSRKSGMTRTSIESDAHDLFETPFDENYPNPAAGKSQYLGVFCLAMGKQDGAPSSAVATDNIKWNTHVYTNWLNNKPARVLKHAASTVSPIDGGYGENYSYIQFMKDDYTDTQVYYYPFGNWYYYDFFAYYPKQDDANVSIGYSYVDVDITIDGSQDVIWAHAAGGTSIPDPVTSNAVNSYSAKYMRLSKEDLDHNGRPDHTEFEVVPGLAFDHKLTQFVFSVQPHDTDAPELYAKGFRLTELSLKNVYDELQLSVASKGGSITAGTLTIKPGSSHVTDIPAWDASDDSNPFSTHIVVANADDDTSPKDVGYAIVPPSALISGKTHNQYLVSIGMEQKDETGKYPGDDGYSGSDVPDTVISLTEPEGGFLAGHKYNITLVIYTPTQIQATATLEDWVSPNDSDHNQTISVD